jgi:hypothetical protein
MWVTYSFSSSFSCVYTSSFHGRSFFLACLLLLFSCPAPVTSGPKSLYYPNETQTQWWRSERGE